MTLISIIATPTGPILAAPAGGAPEAAIAAALAALPPASPVVIMVHGKGYEPGAEGRDPHALIFAARSGHARSRNISWPRRLGFALPGPRRPLGLCIGFGWNATGALWQATRAADEAGQMLARLVQMIRRAAPGRPVDLIGHSLGARVILGAVPLLAAGMVGRVILLAGADFTHRAALALASPAGRAAEFFNITTRENDVFDFLFERALAPFGGVAALGCGLDGGPQGAANWLDLQLDHPAVAGALRGLGLALAPPRAFVCHWSVYLRPGTFRLYRALIHDRERLSLALLRAGVVARSQPRWSRLWAALPRPAAPGARLV